MNAVDVLSFGEHMAYWREAKELSYDQLSQKTGITKGQLNRIERGLSMPSLHTAARICEGFGLSLSQMFREMPAEIDAGEKEIIDALRSGDTLKIIRLALDRST